MLALKDVLILSTSTLDPFTQRHDDSKPEAGPNPSHCYFGGHGGWEDNLHLSGNRDGQSRHWPFTRVM